MDRQLELVDRRVAVLLRQEDPLAFVLGIEPFLAALQSDPIIAWLIEDIMEDVASIVGRMEEADREAAAELQSLRAQFAQLEGVARFESNLALFDDLARAEPPAFTAEGVGGRAGPLLALLRELDVETRPPAPDPHTARLTNLAEEESVDPLAAWPASLAAVLHRYFRALRTMRLRVQNSAGLALLKLDATAEALNPPAVRTDTAGRLGPASVPDRALFNAVWREPPDTLLRSRVGELRDCVERLGEELRARLGTTHSRGALVQRFRQRCEWHDRGRVLAVAEDARLGPSAGERLTAELARYLFDAGLNPVTRLLATRAAPDRFDTGTAFYVEAAQCTDGATREDLASAVHRSLHTMRALRDNGVCPEI
jgi:hypothetical protein